MKKTASQLIEDLCEIVSAGPLAAAVSGRVYRSGIRPAASAAEDIVVSFVSGTAAQVQQGVADVDIFVPGTEGPVPGNAVWNVARCDELESLAAGWAETLGEAGGYAWTPAEMIHTERNAENGAYFVRIRLNFKYTTF